MPLTLRRPFPFGKITLPSNVFCAPLAGCSDLPFRKMTSGYKPGLIYCEMVKMDALIRNDLGTLRLLDYEDTMHPIGGQLCGSKPELAGPCAKIIEDLGFDVVDLNCGCPVDKVTKDGSGSGLLKDLDRIGEILSNMVAAVKIPVTIKIRVGWDFANIVAPQVTAIAEKAGATAICIHGRTRSQGYKGPANWDFIAECKKVAKHILVIANGDVFDPLSAENIFLNTQCDAILLARGTLGRPWLIEEIYRHLEQQSPLELSGMDRKAIFLNHFDHILAYRSERYALLDLRRISCWYLKHAPHMKQLREAVNHAESADEIRQMICDYPWHEASFADIRSPERETLQCS